MKRYKERAITLVVLVITIVILLILAGITLAIFNGNNGLLVRAKEAKEKTVYRNAEEKIKLAVMASYDKDAKLNEEALKENLNKIDGINSKINEIKWNLEVSVDGFGFEITENGNIVYSGKGEDEEKEEVNPNIVVGYTFKNNSKSINKEKIYELKDNTKNNNNSKLYNICLNDEKNGIVFNGVDSYAKLNLQENLKFPMTIETTIKYTKSTTNSVIYLEPKSGTALGIYENYFVTTIGCSTNVVPIPLNFFDGELKHIIVVYNTLNDFDIYINGEKLSKGNSTDTYSSGVGSTPYLGRREKGNYFNGTIYNFRIYKKRLEENEIVNSYNNDMDFLKNGAKKIDRDGLILEYDIKSNHDGQKEDIPYIIKDISNNGSDATFYSAKYDENGNGIVFDGISTYAQLDLKQNLTFPTTVEVTLQYTGTTTNSVIFLDPKSQIGIGVYSNYFVTTINKTTNVIPIQSSLFDGKTKHIVITYNNLTDSEFYLNGNKMIKSTSVYDAWDHEIGNTSVIGKREGGNYFKGIIYNFKIYNRILDENEINDKYKKEIEKLK